MIDGKKGTIGYDESERARGTGHSPVVSSLPLKENNGTYPVGLLVEPDDNGNMVPMTAIAKVTGVMDEEVDTTKSASGLVIVHGSVRLPLLKKDTDGTAPAATDITALRKAGIFAE